LKVLIADDEELARSLIKKFLADFPDFDEVIEASNGFDAVKSINTIKPDLIFLDIEMPKLNGLEVIDLIEEQVYVIFTTAYEQYAVKAFELNAIDFLLKPLTKSRFKLSIDKFMKFNQIDKSQSNEILDRIVFKESNEIRLVNVEDIYYLEAKDDYVMFYSNEGFFLKKTTLKNYEMKLDSAQFIRIHRSYILNLKYLSSIEINDRESNQAVLKDSAKIPISKSGYQILKNRIKELNG
jgi:two-component system, LytTR family, response regulator